MHASGTASGCPFRSINESGVVWGKGVDERCLVRRPELREVLRHRKDRASRFDAVNDRIGIEPAE